MAITYEVRYSQQPASEGVCFTCPDYLDKTVAFYLEQNKLVRFREIVACDTCDGQGSRAHARNKLKRVTCPTCKGKLPVREGAWQGPKA